MRFLNLRPACGRSYADKASAVAAWKSGKDFKIPYGPYCSITDLEFIKAEGYTGVALLTEHGYCTLAFDEVATA